MTLHTGITPNRLRGPYVVMLGIKPWSIEHKQKPYLLYYLSGFSPLFNHSFSIFHSTLAIFPKEMNNQITVKLVSISSPTLWAP